MSVKTSLKHSSTSCHGSKCKCCGEVLLLSRRLAAAFVVVFSLLLGAGCDGGMSGTGSGPTPLPDTPYNNRVMPKQLSVKLPSSLLSKRVAQLDYAIHTTTTAPWTSCDEVICDDVQRNSIAQQVLGESLDEFSSLLLDAEEMLALIDQTFEQIEQQCEAVPDTELCVLPAGRVSLEFTDLIAARVLASRLALAARTGLLDGQSLQDFEDKLSTELQQRIGQKLEPELQYMLNPSADWQRQLQLSMSVLSRETAKTYDLTVRWDDIDSGLELSLIDQESGVENRFDYDLDREKPTSTLLSRASDVDGVRQFNLALTDNSSSADKPVLIDSRRQVRSLVRTWEYGIDGYASDLGGYIRAVDKDTQNGSLSARVVRNSFDKDGNLVAGSYCLDVECSNWQAFGDTELDVSSTPYYLSEEEFDQQQVLYGNANYSVQGLPSAVKAFSVVPAGSGATGELLCDGVVNENSQQHIWCWVEAEQLANVDIYDYTDPTVAVIVPGATFLID